MENFNKYIYILFLGFLLLVGCSPIYHKCGAPDKIISIEPQLIDYLNKHNEIQNVVRKYCLIVNPIITNKNSIGIYSFTYFEPHYTWYYIFMYDGENIYFTNIDDSLGMRTFLDTCGFSKYKIRKFERKVKKIKKKNERVHQSQTF